MATTWFASGNELLGGGLELLEAFQDGLHEDSFGLIRHGARLRRRSRLRIAKEMALTCHRT